MTFFLKAMRNNLPTAVLRNGDSSLQQNAEAREERRGAKKLGGASRSAAACAGNTKDGGRVGMNYSNPASVCGGIWKSTMTTTRGKEEVKAGLERSRCHEEQRQRSNLLFTESYNSFIFTDLKKKVGRIPLSVGASTRP